MKWRHSFNPYTCINWMNWMEGNNIVCSRASGNFVFHARWDALSCEERKKATKHHSFLKAFWQSKITHERRWDGASRATLKFALANQISSALFWGITWHLGICWFGVWLESHDIEPCNKKVDFGSKFQEHWYRRCYFKSQDRGATVCLSLEDQREKVEDPESSQWWIRVKFLEGKGRNGWQVHRRWLA